MLNLRRGVPQKKNKEELVDKLKCVSIKRLSPQLIEELERLVPLEKGLIFNRLGWDCIETREKLLNLAMKKRNKFKHSSVRNKT